MGYEKKEYGDYVPFNDKEVYKFIGILFANGRNPRPLFETWFTPISNRPLFGHNFVSNRVFDRMVHGMNVSGLRRWRHLRRFLTLSDYQKKPADKQCRNPMWKVQSLFDELNHHARQHWIPGKWVAIDEQTIVVGLEVGYQLIVT